MKEIKEWPHYSITEDGNIWSLYSNKWLKQENSGKYNSVCLRHKGEQKTIEVHRLVAEAFIPNPENKPTVDHIDRNTKNNDLSNLRWATSKEQAENRDNYSCGPKKKKVVCVETGEVFESVRSAARLVGSYSCHISSCCKGKQKTTAGYHWQYE